MFRKQILIQIALLVAATGCSLNAQADKKKKKKKETITYTVNTPDFYIEPLAAEKPLAAATEAHLRPLTDQSGIRKGIDVSHYQGLINWKQVAEHEHGSYAYLKATESESLQDDTYFYNLREARRVGIKVGCYHFFSPSTSPDKQYANFKSCFNVKDHDLIPILDVEKINRNQSSYQLCSAIRRFIKLFENDYGFKPIIYTSSNFYNRHLSGSFNDCKFMIARYADEVPYLNDDVNFVMWQFSCKGHVSGIRGYVDMSMIMDDYTLNDILIN